MPKIYNKIINSPTPPKNTSDIWECNGRLYLYKGGGWESIKTDSEYYELPFDFCTLYLLQQGETDPIQINASEIAKAIENNKIIVMRYDMYCPGGYVLVSGYEEDLIYLSAVMGTDLLYWEFTTDEEFIYPEAITYKVIGEGGSSQADWNAQEGEPGYIANKPFYTEGDIRQIDVNGEYSIVVGEFNIGDRIDISWDLVYYNDEIFRGSTSFVIQEGEEPTYYYQENDFYIFGGKTFEMYAYSGGDSHYGKVTYTVNGEIKTLEEKYIPNTVIKTTPQTLSETDKNQALANLGLDPIVWKYICNPIIINNGKKAPEDILTGEFDNTEYDFDFSYYKLKDFVCTAMFKYVDDDDINFAHIYNTLDANNACVSINNGSVFYVDNQKVWHRYDA